MGSYEAYHTTIKCKSTNSKYAYSVAYNLVGDEDIYSVNGQVMQDDATAMEAIRTSVESLKLLKASSTTTSETKKNNTTSSESNSTTQSESGSTASTDGNLIPTRTVSMFMTATATQFISIRTATETG